MGQTPFDRIPIGPFKARQIGICLVVFLALLIWVGIISGCHVYARDFGMGGPDPQLPILGSAIKFYVRLIYTFFHIPDACFFGASANPLQAKGCDEFWFLLAVRIGLAVGPFAVAALLYQLGINSWKNIYWRARKRAEPRKSDAIGILVSLDGDGSKGDYFSWFFEFEIVTVELQNKQRVLFYYPSGLRSPKIGETLVAFDIGSVWGKKRFIATVYDPHIAVVRGV